MRSTRPKEIATRFIDELRGKIPCLNNFSRLGKAFMLPISILPVAGLLLGLGGALSNESAVKTYPFLDQAWLQTILKVMSFAGNAVFANLALIFTIGIAVGLATSDKGQPVSPVGCHF